MYRYFPRGVASTRNLGWNASVKCILARIPSMWDMVRWKLQQILSYLPATVGQELAVQRDLDARAVGVLYTFDVATEVDGAHDTITELP